jgi:type I restriction enzyme S subunit
MKNGKFPVVGSNGIIGYHNKYTTDSSSITIGRSGNVGKPYLLNSKSWSHNTTLFIKSFKKVNPYFIYYFLKNLDLVNFAGGSAVPTLNRNHIHSLPIKIPYIHIQEKIVKILSNIENKIEIDSEINKNLEEQVKMFLNLGSLILNLSEMMNLWIQNLD